MDNDRAARTAHNRYHKREAERAREVDDAIVALTKHPQGRRLLYWLISLGRPGANPFTGNTLSTMFNCGELNIAQQITDRLIRVAPEAYILMLKEMENERLDDIARNTKFAAGEPDAEFGESTADS